MFGRRQSKVREIMRGRWHRSTYHGKGLGYADRQDNSIYFRCDECDSKEIDIDEDDLGEAGRRATGEGWAVLVDDDGKWKHVCPNCVED